MTDLEQIILDKVKVLDTEQQQRFLEFVETLQPATFDYENGKLSLMKFMLNCGKNMEKAIS